MSSLYAIAFICLIALSLWCFPAIIKDATKTRKDKIETINYLRRYKDLDVIDGIDFKNNIIDYPVGRKDVF